MAKTTNGYLRQRPSPFPQVKGGWITTVCVASIAVVLVGATYHQLERWRNRPSIQAEVAHGTHGETAPGQSWLAEKSGQSAATEQTRRLTSDSPAKSGVDATNQTDATRSAESIADAQSSYDLETPDPTWSRDAEALISSVVDSDFMRAYYSVQIQCHVTQCKVEASIDATSINSLGPNADWESIISRGLASDALKDDFDSEATKEMQTAAGMITFRTFIHRRRQAGTTSRPEP